MPDDDKPKTSFDYLLSVGRSRNDVQNKINKLLDQGGNWSADDPIFIAAGTIEAVSNIIKDLENIVGAIPQAIRLMLAEERKAGEDLLDMLLKKAKSLAKIQQKLQLIAISCILSGIILGMIVNSILNTISFQKQLQIARGSDGVLIEWLGTPRGELVRKKFSSGDAALDECIKRGAKNLKGAKSGKVLCTIEL